MPHRADTKRPCMHATQLLPRNTPRVSKRDAGIVILETLGGGAAWRIAAPEGGCAAICDAESERVPRRGGTTRAPKSQYPRPASILGSNMPRAHTRLSLATRVIQKLLHGCCYDGQHVVIKIELNDVLQTEPFCVVEATALFQYQRFKFA